MPYPGSSALKVGLLVMVAILLAPASWAEEKRPVLTYDVKELSSGEHLYTMRGWSEEAPGGRKRVAVVSESTFAAGTVRRDRAVLTLDDPPRCLSFEKITRNKDGEVLERLEQRFVPEAFPLLRQSLPADAYPPEAPLGYVVTRLGLGERDSARFHTVVAGSLMGVDLWVDGRETVRVPAGEFDAYRIHMRVSAETLFPDLPRFVQRFASVFIPRQTFWLTAEEPQVLLKFIGKMGPPGTPDLQVELTSLDADGDR